MSIPRFLPALCFALHTGASEPAVFEGEQGVSFAPLPRVSLEFGSDKLAFAPSDADRFARASEGEEVDYLSPLLRRSFRLEGLDPDRTSKVLSRELGNGVKLWASAHTTLVEGAWKRTEVSMGTDVAGEVRLPGALFLLIFSRDQGLQSGHTLDFTGFRQDFRWTSHILASREFRRSPPPLLAKWGGFDRFVGSLGAGYYMGHSLLLTEMEKGEVKSDGESALLAVDCRMRIRSAGLGLKGESTRPAMEPFRQVAAGHGFGISLGAKLGSERHSLDMRIEDAGAIIWGRTQTGSIRIHGDSLTLSDFIAGLRPPGADSARSNPFREPGDSIRAGGDLVTALPATLTGVYARAWRLGGRPERWSLDQLILEGSCKQALAPGPGTDFIPTLGIALVQPWLRGKLPFRIGWTIGGPELYATHLGMGLRFPRFSCAAEWLGYGALLPVPRRGFRFGWSMRADL